MCVCVVLYVYMLCIHNQYLLSSRSSPPFGDRIAFVLSESSIREHKNELLQMVNAITCAERDSEEEVCL